jgi:hypothetical protein
MIAITLALGARIDLILLAAAVLIMESADLETARARRTMTSSISVPNLTVLGVLVVAAQGLASSLAPAPPNGAPQLTVGVTPTPPIDRLCAVQHLELGLRFGRTAGPWTVADPRSMMRG